VIKIDRSFVSGLPNDPGAGALAQMLLSVTKHFGFLTLAEGVETEEQAAWLVANGCRFGQGFLFAKPLPLTEFLALAERTPAR
jgi:sensor c-di-GMP phosphodiesterase-like protein